MCKISTPLANQNMKEKESACMVKRRENLNQPGKKQTENNNNLDEMGIDANKLCLANG